MRSLLPSAGVRGRLILVTAITVIANLSIRAAVPTLVSGDGHVLALSESGLLYSWGRNDFGQLGLGRRPASGWGGPTFPTVVPGPQGLTWAAVGAGDNHSLAITSDGSLWAWGRNDVTQLSFRTSLTRRWIAGGLREPSPVRISSDKNWAAVSGGMLCSFALKRDGSLWAWGGNWAGQLGTGIGTATEFSAPLEKLAQMSGLNRIGGDADWVKVSAGAEHVLAQKRDGTLWAWGRNDCGQLGVGDFLWTNRPVRISAETNWSMFAAGGAGQRGAWSAATKRDGTLWVWGNWKRLKLANAPALTIDTSMAVRPLQLGAETNWVTVSCGNDIGGAIKTDGTLWTWGATPSGAQPSPVTTAPRQVGSDHDWRYVSLNGSGLGAEADMHALKSDGSVWTWDPQGFPAPGTVQVPNPVSNAVPHQLLWLREPSKTR